uniref:Uncharacterized protein n=1 Tax=Triticum urartu TaxID=4572 RepID=A0A8R7P8E0_TRIUA
MPRSASSHLVNAVAAGRVLFSSRGHPVGRCFLLISDNGSAPSSCLRAGAPIHPWIYVGLLRMDGHVRASLAAQRLLNAAAAGRPAVPCLLPSRGRQCLMFPSGDLRRCTEHPHDKGVIFHLRHPQRGEHEQKHVTLGKSYAANLARADFASLHPPMGQQCCQGSIPPSL